MKRQVIFLFFALFLVLFGLSGKTVLGEEAVGNPLLEYRDNLLSAEANLDQWVGKKGIVDSIVLKGISLIAGVPDDQGNLVGGMIGISGVAMASLFDTPPASGVTYFADLLHNVGIAKPAYAQGVGFSGLSPVLIIWKAFRNFAYLLITVLFIILGLMIMFRVKLSPQAVISVQSAIPKIVTALILITFSYAIAGLLIDLNNLVLVLVIKVLATNGLVDAAQTSSQWLNAGIGNTIGQVIKDLVSGITILLFSNIPTGAASLFGVGGSLAIIGVAVFGGAAAPVGIALLPALLALLLGLLIAIAGLIIRIITMLIKAYVSIIIGVVLGPLQILFDVLPGGKTSAFNSWSKSLLANILVFPVVAILFILSAVFDKALGAGQTLWTPPTLSSNNLMVAAFIKLGILMLIPNVDKVIMQALDVKTSLGSALGRDPLLDKPGRFFSQGRNMSAYKIADEAGLPAAKAGKLSRLFRSFGWLK